MQDRGGSALNETQRAAIAIDEVVEILTNVLDASRSITDAKRIGQDRYFHSSAMVRRVLDGAVSLLTCNRSMTAEDLVFRVNAKRQTVSLLHYPRFLTLAHPALCCSLHADLIGFAIWLSNRHAPCRGRVHRRSHVSVGR